MAEPTQAEVAEEHLFRVGHTLRLDKHTQLVVLVTELLFSLLFLHQVLQEVEHLTVVLAVLVLLVTLVFPQEQAEQLVATVVMVILVTMLAVEVLLTVAVVPVVQVVLVHLQAEVEWASVQEERVALV
jgi:hypothetical protein